MHAKKTIFLAALIAGVFGATGVAQAALTANANAVTSDGVLTITGNDVSVWSVATAAASDNLTIGITGATDSSLILRSTGTGAAAMQITTTAGGLDISVTGDAASEDLDITTSGATTDIIVSSAGAITMDSVGVLELNSSAGVISIGNDAVAQNINVGTGAAARTITIGNTTSTLSLSNPTITTALNMVQAPILLDTLASTGARIQDGGAEVVAFRDSTNARGVNLTLTAGGNQTIAASAGSLVIGSDYITDGRKQTQNLVIADTPQVLSVSQAIQYSTAGGTGGDGIAVKERQRLLFAANGNPYYQVWSPTAAAWKTVWWYNLNAYAQGSALQGMAFQGNPLFVGVNSNNVYGFQWWEVNHTAADPTTDGAGNAAQGFGQLYGDKNYTPNELVLGVENNMTYVIATSTYDHDPVAERYWNQEDRRLSVTGGMVATPIITTHNSNVVIESGTDATLGAYGTLSVSRIITASGGLSLTPNATGVRIAMTAPAQNALNFWNATEATAYLSVGPVATPNRVNFLTSNYYGLSFVVGTAGTAQAITHDITISTGGAANTVLQHALHLDSTIEAGLLGETDGAGSYTQLKTVWKIPYADAGAGTIGPAAPTTAATWNGGLFLGASNAVSNGRLYWYANEGVHYVDATAGFSFLFEEPTTFGDFNNWSIGDTVILKVDRYAEDGGHALPYPFEQSLQESKKIKELEARITELEGRLEVLEGR